MIQNPILKGFNPDPSVICVGEDYYIATSTFEWFPGIALYRSKDLNNWELTGYPLTRVSQLDLKGVPSSCGVWAPSLTYDKEAELFYIVYTNVYGVENNNFDLDNFLITAQSIEGPWSEPIYLNSCGFDPSILHDDDGRKWVVSLEWDFRKGYEHPGAIVVQEYCPKEQKLIGNWTRIWRGGTDRGCLEGPNLYKYNGYYYIMSAEGGTGYGHCVTVGRSKEVTGPYESDPQNPIITCVNKPFNERGVPESLKLHRYNPESEMQKAGHGSLVQTHTGEWYVTHLCARPAMPEKWCMLGRETAIQKMIYTEDGWFRMKDGSRMAKMETEAPNIPEYIKKQPESRIEFNTKQLDIHFQTQRIPFDESWIKLENGALKLKGQESLFSIFKQSLVARRVQSFKCQAETCVSFEPDNYMQMAGLVAYYNNKNFKYLRIYHSESLGGKCLGVMMSRNDEKDEYLESRVLIEGWEKVYMRATINHREMQFYYSKNGDSWLPIGPVLDPAELSDEGCNYQFTGAFVGMCCQDIWYKNKWATFDYFEYKEN